jgi:GT2 family glycosyltransferase
MIQNHVPEWIKPIYRRARSCVLTLNLRALSSIAQPEEELLASSHISVIVPIHDAADVTQRCLQSLEVYGGNAEIVLMDDGSQLQETKDLIQQYGRRNGWGVLRHEVALGHSRSCEDGAAAASRPYLCFLNSDTVVTPCSWSSAVEAFAADAQIAVTGPSTSHSATVQTIRRANYCRDYWTNEQIYAFARQYTSRQLLRSWVDLPIVGGFAFFVRREIWDQFGGFDPELPDYGNESEFCRRLRARGYRVVWTKNGYIHHIGGSSYGKVIGRAEIRRRQRYGRDYIERTHDRA